MKFELLRIFLTVRDQRDLFASSLSPNREAWLRSEFSKGFSFKCRRKDYFYEPDLAASKDTGFVIGRIGREHIAKENLPPEMGLKETRRTSWRARKVLIDPTNHEDGQKVAFEMDSAASKAEFIFKGICDYLNHRDPETPYWMEANGIIDAKDFWDFLEIHKGKVTSIKFELVAPNMFLILRESHPAMITL
jgi:hypothetical protein